MITPLLALFLLGQVNHTPAIPHTDSGKARESR